MRPKVAVEESDQMSDGAPLATVAFHNKQVKHGQENQGVCACGKPNRIGQRNFDRFFKTVRIDPPALLVFEREFIRARALSKFGPLLHQLDLDTTAAEGRVS